MGPESAAPIFVFSARIPSAAHSTSVEYNAHVSSAAKRGAKESRRVAAVRGACRLRQRPGRCGGRLKGGAHTRDDVREESGCMRIVGEYGMAWETSEHERPLVRTGTIGHGPGDDAACGAAARTSILMLTPYQLCP